jgi:predicted MFS family arabinose efflux permease
MSSVEKSAPARPADQRVAHHSGFWAVAFAFLVVMAFATLPSPLYGLYRTRDDLSAFTITIVYAIWAASTIATLLMVNLVVARIGRRGVMLSAVLTMMLAAGLLAAWKDLPGLLIGRLLTGVAVGLAAGTAIVYLIELRVRSDPKASVVRARTIGTSVNVGALGIGPLIAGCLAQWAKWPLTLPYLVFAALGAAALIGLATAPETGAPAPRERTSAPPTTGLRRMARLPVPAAAATLAAFAANGLFAGLSGLFLATTLQHPSHALAGVTLFLVFSAGVVSQLATTRLQASRVLTLGTLFMLVGLVLLVVAVRLSTPSLAIFLISGALIGAGAGAVFKGTTGIVLEASAPQDRVAMTSALLISLFVGLSVPVVGAGIALNAGASAADTVLGFAILVGLGVAGAGALLERGQKPKPTT